MTLALLMDQPVAAAVFLPDGTKLAVLSTQPPAGLVGQRLPIAATGDDPIEYHLADRGEWTVHAEAMTEDGLGAELRRLGSVRRGGSINPNRFSEGSAIPLPLSVWVGSATVDAVLPVVGAGSPSVDGAHIRFRVDGGLSLERPVGVSIKGVVVVGENISSELVWHPGLVPGVWVVLLGDPQPASERCPACGGEGTVGAGRWFRRCPVCLGAERLSVPVAVPRLPAGLHEIDLTTTGGAT